MLKLRSVASLTARSQYCNPPNLLLLMWLMLMKSLFTKGIAACLYLLAGIFWQDFAKAQLLHVVNLFVIGQL